VTHLTHPGVYLGRMTHRPLALALVCALTGACAGAAPTDPLQSNTHAVVNASVRFLNLEGGCWTLEPAPGVHYLPLNLPEQFRRDGLNVQADLLRRDDYASICMVGPVVEILSIRSP
jgi:hypothetical protein